MGYIAPVTQFDYIQYANRIVRAAENVRNVKGTAPIQPIRYNQVMEDETGRFKKNCQLYYQKQEITNGTGTYKIQMGLRKKEELTAELIGKGEYFNEVV
ncbi:hypothetical protein CN689_03020 [Peribacillus butanolivorans]|uniref:Uncharacterized protein n=1 Tax=Peribacillus butanolivorans TaxID=421767 RepID=A0AAX0S9S1_9BACI|nr:hypothetical protein [Peribacillus butanolivorans]PEJ36831.1 hypothetical protein CN689_03020 [Peribacillus butanolivorans]